MTRNQAVAKFGEASADAIILRKMNDPTLMHSEIKRHPDLPDSVELMQFLILDMEQEIEEEEEVMSLLYKLAEAKDDDSSSGSSGDSGEDSPKNKGKNKKKKALLHAYFTCSTLVVFHSTID